MTSSFDDKGVVLLLIFLDWFLFLGCADVVRDDDWAFLGFINEEGTFFDFVSDVIEAHGPVRVAVEAAYNFVFDFFFS